MEDKLVENWIKDNFGSESGFDSGYGSGSGSGLGNGFGSGYGLGSGSGLGVGSGYDSGLGFGDGDGSGSGSGFGYGYGYGYGSGDGYGDGSGDGYGDGVGLFSVNSKRIWIIDNLPTLIVQIKEDIAKGFIFREDFTFEKCYVAKGNGYFSHGKTVKEAVNSLRIKMYENMNTEEVIDNFIVNFEKGKTYPGHEFFNWHNYLTGSCLMGREEFVKSHNLDLDKKYSVDEFIQLCENAYGKNVILELKKRWGNLK